MAMIEESQGPDVELKVLLGQMISKIIPRLLRPLETGGRQINPRLVHGDLCSGNVSTDAMLRRKKTRTTAVYSTACESQVVYLPRAPIVTISTVRYRRWDT